ncbi:extradiol ring-cleavage dioxygenase [Penicillium digitatum]|uniref:F-box domain-containing protein n=3 Tax=Penicillium digitatum TaxID=36651 RepID=K9GUB3_PEND2|nr:hypothetical protein PDIP_82080 [Penicillium digitatum Pd1]EKV05609.1 hypothetical protein PDIP_82080 [Penicillium digitatum Pd1]EKV18203.1 hypothetical protein PDIG_10570 [Penicillium digitatum PHI26]QQK40409.1 extradiol ring-cleavage dioxygenase [Penicillium digitatum]
MAAVNRNMFEVSITQPPGGAQLMVLPLNLIAEIVSHVDDTGDLARLCRTCRVLNYMALPQLYRSLTLTSYDKIRYRGEQPEGIGSASPFTMGLNAIITRSYATLVRSMTLRGEWKGHELEEHARVGRVPDASMLLNIAARAAVDRMTNLESFHWELNTKMLDTVYTGLTQLPKLTSLTIRFPSSRHPQPTFVIPGMPHLRCLKITDIDPLCYPDDIATLLCKSRNLCDLKLHWSPRMRDAHEPSVSLHDYFRKLIASKRPLTVKKLSFQNLYAFHTDDFNYAFDPTTVEDVTFLSGVEGSSLVNTFIESSWPRTPPHAKLHMKSVRVDAVSKRNSEFIGNFFGLERLYFVNVTSESSDLLNCPRPGGGAVSSALTPPTSEYPLSGAPNGTATNATNSPIASASPVSQLNAMASMRDLYLSHITTNHGASLRHLLLPSRWPLSTGMIARLVHSCPNLEQLALATEFTSLESLGLLIPFLRNLKALRLLIPQSSGQSASSSLRTSPTARGTAVSDLSKAMQETLANAKTLAEVVDIDDSILTEMLSYELANKQVFGNVKVISMGWKAWELRDFYKAPIPLGIHKGSPTPTNNENASPETTTNSPVLPQGPSGTGFNTPYQPIATYKSPDTQATQISSWTNPRRGVLPPSILGKRSRDRDESETPRPPTGCPFTFDRREGSEDATAAYAGCYPYTLTDDGFVWRRRARRVGWEVLKHWEVWALDTQEI